MADVYHPDFDCSRMDRNEPGQVLLCSDSDSARSELVLDQAYYALRHQSAAYSLPQLKAELIHDLAPLQACFSPAGVQGESQAQCYQRVVAQVADRYRSRLTGRAHEEATRPIDAHIALQRKLQALGFLPAAVVPDGVYGEATRRAILRWQEQAGQPSRDGFLGDDDARVLMPDLAVAPAPSEASPSPPERAAPRQAEAGTVGGDGPVASVLRQSGTAGAAGPQPSPPSPDSTAPQQEAASPQTEDHETAGGLFSLLSVPFWLLGAVIHMCGAVLAGVWHVLIFILLLPVRLVRLIWSFITWLFSWKGLLLLLVGLIVNGLRSAEKKDDSAQSSEFPSREEEAAQEQQERAQAYRRARQSGSAPPEDEPWHIVLEVSATASAEEITASYRRLMKQHHPDRFAQEGGAAYEAAVVKSKKITEAYRYAKTLKQFSEKTGRTSRQKPEPETDPPPSGFASSREQEAYQAVGMMWAGWISELALADGQLLLDHLVARRLREAFRFLSALVQPMGGETARNVLEELEAGRSWQDFRRCSVHVHGLLLQVNRAETARKRRRQEQQRAWEREEAERRREQARRDWQRARNAPPADRAWHVVLEVSEGASNEEIISAYRRLVKQHHPDRFAHVGGDVYQEAVRRTAEITQAYRYVRQYRRF
ncbi:MULTISPECIES: DnaJ domain-containing protein [unclassified Parasaccharibacter]|uniref:DnaJ domain-containing protein n=1 Tax=unclassified Parasaccharibacter TaxID=2626400 RepID=UPI002009E20A|nr:MULTISPECIES: DnaJ domain-containing protein [unclassified Parasaccharibacter]